MGVRSCSVRDRRIQAVVATMGLSGSNSRRCMAIAGVIPPSVLRGLPLSSVATSSSRAGEWTDRSVPLGKYWRNNPFVFSLEPRCQGEWGSPVSYTHLRAHETVLDLV